MAQAGYNVRKSTGLTERERFLILLEVFRADLKPASPIDEEYVKEWDAPCSSGRLSKIVNSLATFVRQQKRNPYGSESAIERRQTDLEGLRRTLYEPIAFLFRWPSTEVW